jgi:hypothetical protein
MVYGGGVEADALQRICAMSQCRDKVLTEDAIRLRDVEWRGSRRGNVLCRRITGSLQTAM